MRSAVFFLCIVVVLSAMLYAAQSATVKRPENIPAELFAKYEKSAKEFAEKTKGWSRGDYRLSFGVYRESMHMVAFNASHRTAISDMRKRRAEGEKGIFHHPMSIGILVDTRDFRAYEDDTIQENPWRDENGWREGVIME